MIQIRYFLFLSVSLLMFSCQQETFEADVPRDPADVIRFEVQTDRPDSRVVYDEDMKAVFTEDDEIGIFAVKYLPGETASLQEEDNYMQNVKYTLQNDGTWAAEIAQYYPNDGSVLDFYAYYPYVAGFNPVTGTSSFSNEDLMTVRKIGVEKSDQAVSLTFDHKLALLRIEAILPGWDALQPAISGLELFFTSNMAEPGLKLGASEPEHEIVESGMPAQRYKLSPSAIPGMYDVFLPEYAAGKLKEVKMTTKDSKSYTFDLQSETIDLTAGNIVNLEVSLPADYIDYSDLPNCYVVKPGNTMHIPVYKAYSVWNNNTFLKVSDVDLTGELKAELVWMDAQGLITNAGKLEVVGEGENALIKAITAPDIVGNAVIAAKIDGVIRWSWHLWVTDEDVTTTSYTYNNTDRNITFMDRNLGAMNATVADAGSKGLLYQWGRKDPFVGSSDWTDANSVIIYNAEGEINASTTPPTDATFQYGIFTKSVTSDNTNIAAAVIQPNVMYVYVDNPWGEDADELWGDSGDKSPFDPCPKGWRVPNEVERFEGSVWDGLEAPDGQTESNFINYKGYDWGTILGYYPAAGYRGNNTGQLSLVGWYGIYRSSANSGTNGRLLFFNSGTVNTRYDDFRSFGFSVRCVCPQN